MAADLASALVRAGHDVTVVTTGRSAETGAHEVMDGYRIVRLSAWNGIEERTGIPFPLLSPSALEVLHQLICSADVVHVHDFLYPPCHAGIALTALTGRPLVLSLHVARVPHTNPLTQLAQGLIAASMGRFAVKRAARVIVHNENVAAFAEKLGAPPRRIKLVRTGVSVSEFTPSTHKEKRAALVRFGLPLDRPVVLFVGRLVPKKGYLQVIEATSPDIHLALAGSGSLDGVVDHVTWLGPVARGKLVELYRAASVLVAPYDREPFTLVLQEAMASGIPVITTEEAEYHAAGLGFPAVKFARRTSSALRSAIDEVMGDASLAVTMARAARRYAEENFDKRLHVQAVLEAYVTAVRPRRHHAREGDAEAGLRHH
ncbi:glycosyl transferase group 1 [Kineococcus radiotolerans SRS30216 = ATCC BAA-149]|uniref:Glycosyl transferase group 1 n=1 Tax=Kineococcus radiotolerans (strain ATCC BAA-149 / DSM 14245 / SRS30216) TaxID=266940 RepID=A6W6V4_KINRD|nr:glycosyl transferase group 1 [Kineococcus radiotolerans SRS30216 = ATCC BAA-149]